jgi:hypothetical protein
MKVRLTVGCLAILTPLILLGCASTAEWRAAQADDIYAAVFRYRFQDEFPDVLDEETFYISVNDKDPSDRLLELLSDEMPVVKKASDWDDSPDTGVRIGIGRLTWMSNEDVTVNWGTREGRCVFNNQCRLVLGADGWRVSDVRAIAAAMMAH